VTGRRQPAARTAERKVEFRAARPADIDGLLRLQARYYLEDGYPHRARSARRAWAVLLSDHRVGGAWVAESRRELVGYVVVTLGFSLEYLGVDAFVDELYLAPAVRRMGLGRVALQLAERGCRKAGVRALHLEVERGKAGARELYRRAGFADHERLLMTKQLGRR
jgi:GNAT superfamily N-acetyltransferase